MKKLIIIIFSLTGLVGNVNAQMHEYNVHKTCNNTYRPDFNSWSGWSKWENFNPTSSIFYEKKKIVVSNSTIGYFEYFNFFSEKKDQLIFIDTKSYYKIVENLNPNKNKKFQIKCLIEKTSRSSGDNKDAEDIITKTTGQAEIYSPSFDFNSLVNGTAVGDIYFKINLEGQPPAIYGFNINKMTIEEISAKRQAAEEEQEERNTRMEERMERRRQERSDTYKSIGKSIGTIIQQRKKN